MSEDLFQLIALGLLVLLVLVLVVVAIQLARLRGSLGPGADVSAAPTPAGVPPSQEEEGPGAVGPSSNGESEAVPEIEQPSYETAAVEPPSEPELEPEPEPVPEPVAAAEPEPAAAARDEVGQPFERDGRWWFQRDDELLVYDDRSGQWVPAADETPSTPPVEIEPEPEPAARSRSWLLSKTKRVEEPEPVPTSEPEPVSRMDPDPTPAAATPAPEGTVTAVPEAVIPPGTVTPLPEELTHPLDEPRPEDQPDVALAAATEQPAVEEKPQVASFWKCPSCGVVNGSTASSCRMCFTARP